MGQNIQEWAKQNLWKTAFNKFTWSILEHFVPNYGFKFYVIAEGIFTKTLPGLFLPIS